MYTTEVLRNVASGQEAKLATLKRILSGEVPRQHKLQFLKKNNHTDMLLIKRMKEAIGEKNSVAHGACVWANAIMNCMTTNDSFLRDNLNWVGRATNWARFAATASIGVIHIGNTSKALELLNPYLVGGGGDNSSPYSTSGAYYAYGMIHVNQFAPDSVQFLVNAFRNSGNNENIQHGICLGLGLIAMATGDETVYEELKNVLYTDSAVAGEAAGLAMGLVMLGTANETAI